MASSADALDPSTVTPLVHLYRGELGRMTTYRVRLDTTTNWAVGSTAAIVSFGLSHEDVPHFVMVLALLFDLVFVWMESRRYQDFETIRARVRLLERNFYGAVLGATPAEGWEEELRQSLASPSCSITLLQALSVRLRRNYLWLFLTAYLGWGFKLVLHGRGLPEAAAVGPLPGPVVVVTALGLLVPLVVIAGLYRPTERS